MSTILSDEQKREFLGRGFSRRHFGRLAALMTAGAGLPFYDEPAMAQLSMIRGPMPPGAVKINANENPLGPCAEAREAIHGIVKDGGRYMYEKTFELQEIMADMEGLKPAYVQAFAGSSAPLHQSVLAFASPTRSFVTAEPGYEAGERAARFVGAKVVRVPLTGNHSHDVRKMAAADPNAGLIYICNPNNPTGTLTSDEDLDWLVENKPKDSIILLDEAYIHIAGARMRSDLAAKDKDIIVLRTFSKIYGMAGLRAGAALARPDLLQKITRYSAGALPITAMVAASTSLKVKNLVPERRKIIQDVRENTFAFLEKHKFQYIPSRSNCFMVNVKRPGNEIVMAMRKEAVYIGRVWPSLPTYVRVTVGTQEEMNKFQTAFLKVMA